MSRDPDEGTAREALIAVRLSADEREEWRVAAALEGESLSSWIRSVVGRAAARVLERAAVERGKR
jgi:uncharacterized protein (DUF1778 family)